MIQNGWHNSTALYWEFSIRILEVSFIFIFIQQGKYLHNWIIKTLFFCTLRYILNHVTFFFNLNYLHSWWFSKTLGGNICIFKSTREGCYGRKILYSSQVQSIDKLWRFPKHKSSPQGIRIDFTNFINFCTKLCIQYNKQTLWSY